MSDIIAATVTRLLFGLLLWAVVVWRGSHVRGT